MTIEVFADVACPWCFIGDRRLQSALRSRPDLPATVVWRPFRLQPDLPQQGIPWRLFAEHKFGGWDRARAVFRSVEAVGAGEGISFDLEGIAAAADTMDAHRLILHAQELGDPWPLVDALFRGLFEERRHIGDRDTLADIAEQVSGIPPEATRDILSGDDFRDEVLRSEAGAARKGIQGVPHFVFDGETSVSGAQPVEALLRVIDSLMPSHR